MPDLRRCAMDKKKVIRRIVDYLHKYASEDQLAKIAKFLGIETGETK
jgi:hypothetical protein